MIDWVAIVGTGVVVQVLNLGVNAFRTKGRDAVGDYQKLLDECKDEHVAKDAKLDRVVARLDQCEEQHAETREVCARLEERVSWLEKKSDPPPKE